MLTSTAPLSTIVHTGGSTPAKIDKLPVPGTFPLTALEKLSTQSPSGAIFRLDAGFLDALRLQVRRFLQDGNPGFMIQFKVSGPSRGDFTERMKKKGAEHPVFEFYKADPEKVGSNVVLKRTGEKHALSNSYSSHKAPNTGSQASKCHHLFGDGWTVDYIPEDGPIALRGAVRIQLWGDDDACEGKLKTVLDKLGLQGAFAPVTETAVTRYKLMKALWRIDPKKAKELANKPLTDVKVAKVQAALTEVGYSESRIKGLRYEEVAPGHFTVWDPEASKEMKKHGLRYCYSTVAMKEHVLSILQDGQKATLTRWNDGMIVSGMSSMADVGSGGAQGVFSRIVTDKANSKSWTGRKYKIILKPELLNRLDVWGWSGDFYGKSWDLTERNFGPKLLEDIHKSGYAQYNEVISPVGNSTRFIAGVVATSENDRNDLIKHLKDNGYKPPEGGSIEDFVKLSPSIDSELIGS